ncbi:MAG: GNAT family N-acetyltransferase [Rhodospirillaceae bacterium]
MNAIRILLPTEMSRYRAHLLRLTSVDRHLRFGGSVGDAVIEQHCLRLDWHDTIVIGYFVDGELRGGAELRTAGDLFPSHAEMAFSVERAYQGRGVGSALMARVLTVARNRGIRQVNLICLLENRAMQSLARKFSQARVVDSGEVGVSINLQQADQVSLITEAFEEGAALIASVFTGFPFPNSRTMH